MNFSIEKGEISQTKICTGVQAGATWFSAIITLRSSERLPNGCLRGKSIVLCSVEGKTQKEVQEKMHIVCTALEPLEEWNPDYLKDIIEKFN